MFIALFVSRLLQLKISLYGYLYIYISEERILGKSTVEQSCDQQQFVKCLGTFGLCIIHCPVFPKLNMGGKIIKYFFSCTVSTFYSVTIFNIILVFVKNKLSNLKQFLRAERTTVTCTIASHWLTSSLTLKLMTDLE